MFKHKIIKYLLIFFLSITIPIFLIIIRLSYAPADISYLSKYIPHIKKYTSSIEGLETRKILISLDLLKNNLYLDLSELNLKKYDTNIKNFSVNKLFLGFAITDIIQRKLLVKSINISKGNLDYITEENNNYSALDISDLFKKIPFNKVVFKDINLNVYSVENKIASVNGISGLIIQENQSKTLKSLQVNNINYFDKKNKINIGIKNLNLSSNISQQYNLKLDNIVFNKEAGLFNYKKLLKKITSISISNIEGLYNIGTKIVNLNGQLLLENKKNKLNLELSLANNLLDNLNLKIDFQDFPISTIFEGQKYKKYYLKNIDLVNINGRMVINYKENKLNKLSVKLKSKINEGKKLKVNNVNNRNLLNIEEFYINAVYKNKKIDLSEFKVVDDNKTFNLNGKIFNADDNYEYKLILQIKDYTFKSVNKLLAHFYPDSKRHFKNVSSSKIKEATLAFNLINGLFSINSLDGHLINTELKIKDFLNLKIPELKVKKIKEDFNLNTKFISMFNSKNAAKLYDVQINFKDIVSYKNILENLASSASIDINYIFLSDLVEKLELKKINLPVFKNLEGKIKGKINFNPNEKNYLTFSGELIDSSYKNRNNENKFPIEINDYNASILLNNDKVNINGYGYINDSKSHIIISKTNNSEILLNISSNAKSNSFNFLNDFNYIKDGISKLEINIIKKLNSNKWLAEVNANLFANTVELDFIEYIKDKNNRGKMSGFFYFEGLKLKRIENLELFTEDLLIKSELNFDQNMKLKKVKVNEYISGSNSFSIIVENMSSKEKKIIISGESLDLKELLNRKKSKIKDLTLLLNINKTYYGKFNLGKLVFESKINDNTLISINGDIYNKNNTYVKFSDKPLDEFDKKQVEFKFNNFGLFMSNSNISQDFINGSGIIAFNLHSRSFSVESGFIDLSECSIKNASSLARLLQLASFTGLLEILTKEGIPFNNILGKFKIKDDQIIIEEGKLKGFSLGGTVTGTVSKSNKSLNLEGIIVPAYAINSLINKIPILGQVITGVEGEGLIGVNYKAKGTIEKPDYTINPLSILTPGIFRSIFDQFGKEKNKDNTR